MRTIVYASLSANGLVLPGDNENHKISNEVMADIMQKATAAGNLVFGRKTFDLLLSSPAARAAFSGIELVVMSRKMEKAEGYTVVGSVQEALDHLRKKGFSTALVAGGGEVYSSFIDEGRVNEIYFNINPVIIGEGGALSHSTKTHLQLQFTSAREISPQVVQLVYTVG